MCHLRACRTAMEMELVENEEEIGVRIGGDPGTRSVEYRGVHFTVEHGAEHRDIGDEQIWWPGLHVPARQDFAAVHPGEGEPTLRLETSVRDELVDLCL